ncbi:MAG: hypothetical protein GF331_19545 [Chitinivibrionales bacterium]|nr:hypothetical protein [Chitinivibrionales bacterium]
MSTPSAFFVSDAHLGVSRTGEARQARLVRFLESTVGSAQQLFLVGDIFDFWIEYGPFIRGDFFPVLQALARLRRAGTQLHYIAGNHDFALGPFLSTQVGVQVHERAFDGELQGRRVRVVHGDGLLDSDRLYRLLRAVLRNRLNQRLYRLLHPALGVGLASLASRTSRTFSRGGISDDKRGRYRDVARRTLDEGTDIFVMGHTHCAELFAGDIGTYCNTGEWLQTYNFAKLSDGEMSLWRYRDDSAPERIQAEPWK